MTPRQKRILRRSSFSFLILLGLLIGLWRLHKSPTFQLAGKLIPRVNTQQKVVAITFDDGPSNASIVYEVLDLLDSLEVKATFFLIGQEMEAKPSLTQEIADRGHELANHSYSHQVMLFQSQDWIEQELSSTDALIRRTGHQGEIFFRPPYGKRLFTLPYYLSKQGQMTISWDVDADSRSMDAKEITNNVLSQVQPGSIILMHVMVSSRKGSRAALPDIIQGLRDQGYGFLTVSELLGTD